MDAQTLNVVIAQAAPSAAGLIPPGFVVLPQTMLWGLVLATGILFYGLGRVLELLAVWYHRRSRVRIVWVDPDAGGLNVAFEKRIGNEVPADLANEKARVILDGKARFAGKWPTWIAHARHGWTMVPLGDADAVQKDPLILALAPSNPASYYHAIQKNEARDALEANTNQKDWIGTAIVALLILGVLTLAGLGFFAYKVSTMAAGAAGAGAGGG